MTTSLKAHFDGKVIVPDEPVELPADTTLDMTVELSDAKTAKACQEATEKFLNRAAKSNVSIGARTWTREDLYER